LLTFVPEASRAVIRERLSPTRFQERLLKRRYRKHGLRTGTTTTDFGHFAYWLGDNNAPPLVLLHGFGASALWQWYPQIAALSKQYRLIIPDLLFFGGSTTSAPDRSITFQAEAICELLNRLDIPQADMMGISYGGFVTYTIATKWPERIRRMILVGCPGDVITRTDHEATLKQMGVEHISDLLLPDDPSQLRRLLGIAWHKPPRLPLALLRDAHRNLMSNHVERKRELLLDLLEYLDGHRSQIPRQPPKAQTLLLWGEHDAIFPLHLAQRLQQKIGDHCQLEILKKAAHAPNLEQKRRFNRSVLRFLEAP